MLVTIIALLLTLEHSLFLGSVFLGLMLYLNPADILFFALIIGKKGLGSGLTALMLSGVFLTFFVLLSHYLTGSWQFVSICYSEFFHLHYFEPGNNIFWGITSHVKPLSWVFYYPLQMFSRYYDWFMVVLDMIPLLLTLTLSRFLYKLEKQVKKNGENSNCWLGMSIGVVMAMKFLIRPFQVTWHIVFAMSLILSATRIQNHVFGNVVIVISRKWIFFDRGLWVDEWLSCSDCPERGTWGTIPEQLCGRLRLDRLSKSCLWNHYAHIFDPKHSRHGII